jgi:transposase
MDLATNGIERRIAMIYAKIKDQEELIRLQDAMKASQDKNWYRRLQVIELSAEKYSVQELCDTFKLCEATIRNYIRSYNEGGLDKLAPVKPPGRPPKISHWSKEQWDEVLGQTPDQYEKLNIRSRQWTLERLQLYVKEYHQIAVSIVSIHNSLRKTGRRTGRSKLRVGSPDPVYRVKRKQIENLRDFP